MGEGSRAPWDRFSNLSSHWVLIERSKIASKFKNHPPNKTVVRKHHSDRVARAGNGLGCCHGAISLQPVVPPDLPPQTTCDGAGWLGPRFRLGSRPGGRLGRCLPRGLRIDQWYPATHPAPGGGAVPPCDGPGEGSTTWERATRWLERCSKGSVRAEESSNLGFIVIGTVLPVGCAALFDLTRPIGIGLPALRMLNRR
jgi:hypothetical protein